ncbi:MAG: endo-polygalacturonase [Candidatus Omnitrophica bacterium]|nr:endo-polygalacturonase [Candidatus Omnitrophota bacterium]
MHIFPAPAGEPLSQHFTVTVENQKVPVYIARVSAITIINPEVRQDGEAAFASFDIDGNVNVTVTYPQPVQTAKILPLHSGISPVISGNQITFSVSGPACLTLEINGDWMNSLHLFINPFESNIPQPNDPNVIYYGPGIHKIRPLKVSSGKTVYIAGGAVVYGKAGFTKTPIFSLDGSNIVLRGRGIIDGSMVPNPARNGNILKVQGNDIRIEGIILRDSASWTLPIISSNRVKVNNIKILGWRDNSDGIDIVNSHFVEASNSFLRTFDDLIVIKTIKKNKQGSSNIVIKHNVLWNEIAHALSLGAELQENIDNVIFSDCDIIHDKGREWLLRVFNADSGTVRHIVFDNIRVEEARRLMSLWIGDNIWSKDAERGNIEDVVFSNIRTSTFEQTDPFAELAGFDPKHAIRFVKFENVSVGDRRMEASDIDQNDFVGDVSILP